ncbi:MAG: Bax inhibitor-1/YccA family protein [Gemmatimonadota bacterium]|nr:Bax inhibitor-1/YccA family protein [Gemmatimonadota bacterium]
MARSNPAFRGDIFRTAHAGSATDRMTVSGTVIKSMVLILLTALSTAWVWSNNRGGDMLQPAMLVGGLGGFIVAMITVFRPQVSPFTAPVYAVLEGIFLGAISALYQARFHGLPATAVGLTVMVALGMLVAYSVGLLKATETFKRVIVSATIGIGLFYLFSIVLGFFGVHMSVMYDSSPLGIGLSLVITAVAAFNLILDFDMIEQGAKMGAAKYMEWYGGFALLVTLIWLYLEMLRLLSRLQRR